MISQWAAVCGILAVIDFCSAAVVQFRSLQHPLQGSFTSSPSNTFPVVLWHGLGDNAYSAGMNNTAATIQDVYPGTFVHSIYLDEDAGLDRRAAVFGNLNEQVRLNALDPN